jgi:hypothetical protein
MGRVYLPLPATLVASAYAVAEQALLKFLNQSSVPVAALASAKDLAVLKAKPSSPPLLNADPDAYAWAAAWHAEPEGW